MRAMTTTQAERQRQQTKRQLALLLMTIAVCLNMVVMAYMLAFFWGYTYNTNTELVLYMFNTDSTAVLLSAIFIFMFAMLLFGFGVDLIEPVLGGETFVLYFVASSTLFAILGVYYFFEFRAPMMGDAKDKASFIIDNLKQEQKLSEETIREVSKYGFPTAVRVCAEKNFSGKICDSLFRDFLIEEQRQIAQESNEKIQKKRNEESFRQEFFNKIGKKGVSNA